MNLIKKITTKYVSLNIGVKAALWFTVCNLLQKGITMISMPIFTRLLSTQQYGVFTVYQSWYSIISIIVTLNLAGSVINNGMVKYKGKRSEFISSMQGLSTCITLIFFFIYLAAMKFWNNLFHLSSVFMLTMFVQLLFEPAYLFWAQRQRYEKHYKSLVAVTLGLSAASPILGIITVISTNYKAEARVISFALVQICIGLVFYIIQTIRGKKLFVKEFWIFALKFNIPLIPHYLSQIILGQSDRIMIERICGAEQAAVYGVAYNLATVMTLFVNAINSSFIPSMYENIKSKNYKKINDVADFLCAFMAVIVCIFILFGPEAIAIFAAPEYKKAVWIFPPVAASIFFTYLYTLFINVEFYFEKTSYVMSVSIVGAALNILLNYIFIPKYGFIAAAYTTVFCYILFAAGHFLLYKFIIKKEKIESPIFNAKKIMLYSAAVLSFIAVSTVLYKFNIIRYIVIFIIAISAAINYKKVISILRRAFNK